MSNTHSAGAGATEHTDHDGHDHVHSAVLDVTRTDLLVPQMCCPTEFGMIDKELRRLPGVKDVAPDFVRKAVRIEHDGIASATLLSTAQRSGLTVALTPEKMVASAERSVIVIDKMDCPTEEALIRKRLGKERWVSELSFDLMARKLTIDHESGRLPDVLGALDDIGLDGQPQTADAPAATAPVPSAVSAHWKLAVAGVLAIGAELVAYFVGDKSWAVIAMAFGAVALSGLQTYRKGWYAVRQFNLNINALMSVAVTGAAILGQWPEAAMVMVLFSVAELIEAKSLDRARRAVEGLMAMAPETATIQADGGWQEVPAAQVAIGAVVRVRPGERIALDGTVTAGASAVDQAAITGESLPLDKAVGDPLYAGTVNQNGELQYRVTARADNSTLSRIIHAVQEAQGSRAPTQRFVDTFSRYYTPIVFAVAVLIAIVPPLMGFGDWMSWIYRALVMLVIACPCALVISTPVAVVSGLTAAARRGILIKGGAFLEQGHKLRVIALDKTGTLTIGRPVVVDIKALQGSEQEVLRSAAALSSRSDHPVSRAVTVRAGSDVLPVVDAFTALQGRGVEGTIDGARYRLGNHRLAVESGASTTALKDLMDALELQGKSVIVLLRENTAIALFAVADSVRLESVEAIAQLKQLGVRTVMLTGDNRYTAQSIAAQVGIDDVRSELLPEDKLKIINELSAEGLAVGMVGDGINDAPALAKAHVGFAMGAAGTDTAIETADVALMDDDPRKLAEFIRLSRRTKSVLWQNITFALGIKVVFLALAMIGSATLWMAVFADVGASLLVVFNGLRLLRPEAIK